MDEGVRAVERLFGVISDLFSHPKWGVLAIDGALLTWLIATILIHSAFPPETFAPWLFSGFFALFGAIVVGVIVIAFLMFLYPIGKFMISAHIQFWRTYVPTSRNQTRWVLNALAKDRSNDDGGPR